MRLAVLISSAMVASVCSARADEGAHSRQLRFGNALTGGHISACSVEFYIGFDDPRGPSREYPRLRGEITFSQRNGNLTPVMTMRAFGDSSTKFTGIGRISDVTLTGGHAALRLALQDQNADEVQEAVPSDQVPDLLTIIQGEAILGFTLSEPARSFALPFSLHDMGPGGTADDLAEAGRLIFEDCMTALARAPD